MSIVAGIMVPHPPLIIPEVGHGEEIVIKKTASALKQLGDFVSDIKPDTIVISSPHSTMYIDYFHISPGASASGSLSSFRAPQVKFSINYDEEFITALSNMNESFPAGTLGERTPSLDHGTMVPLYFLNPKELKSCKFVRVGLSRLSLATHYRFGQLIQKTAENLDRKVLYIASGDLSHKLKKDGPYGFSPEGPKYDKKIIKLMGNGKFGQLFDFSESFLDKAAECGHRSFVILAGALDGLKLESKMLSYQDVTGVGYGVCSYKVIGKSKERKFLDAWEKEQKDKIKRTRNNEAPHVTLARTTVESYILNGSTPNIPKNLPEEMYDKKAGVFVSIHKEGQLRGCIGTIEATCNSIAEEIIQNAISASTRDPRFPTIKISELENLDYSVDVLGSAEEVDSVDDLDPNVYGVIVSKGFKRGLLLPMLDEVDTAEEQISIARRKAGIKENEPIKLQRFKVIRYK